jgi:uncharacterized protein
MIMKRLTRIPWWLRLICILVVIVITGKGLNVLYRWHINRSLMLATERGDIAEITRRVTDGADINASISHKQTHPTPALYLASMLHRKEPSPRKARTTLLMVAVVSRRPKVVQTLLDRGANVDARDEYGFTALTMAISVRQPKIIEMLLAHHADPNARNEINMPPLTWALMLRQTAIADILLKAGADPNARDRDDLPPIYLAILDDEADAVRALLAHGADPNAKYRNYPVFRTAVEQGNASIVTMLLHAGAKADAVFADGHTPLELARNARQHDLADLLIQAGAMK